MTDAWTRIELSWQGMEQWGGVLAQSGSAPGVSSGTQADGGTGGAAGGGAGGAGGQGAAGGGGGMGLMLPLLFAFLLVMILTSAMGGRKQKKQREQMLRSISKHDTVQTVGGIVAPVVEVKDDVVVLKIDENANVKMKVSRASVQQVVKYAAGGPAGNEELVADGEG